MKIIQRPFNTRKNGALLFCTTRYPFHKYIKIGSGACFKCMCYEGKNKERDVVKCSFPE